MKKVFIYFFVFLLVFFLLPAFLTKKNVEAKVSSNSVVDEIQKEKETNVESYNYKKSIMISLFFSIM